MVQLLDLPNDILLQIFDELQREDFWSLIVARRTCRSVRNLLDTRPWRIDCRQRAYRDPEDVPVQWHGSGDEYPLHVDWWVERRTTGWNPDLHEPVRYHRVGWLGGSVTREWAVWNPLIHEVFYSCELGFSEFWGMVDVLDAPAWDPWFKDLPDNHPDFSATDESKFLISRHDLIHPEAGWRHIPVSIGAQVRKLQCIYLEAAWGPGYHLANVSVSSASSISSEVMESDNGLTIGQLYDFIRSQQDRGLVTRRHRLKALLNETIRPNLEDKLIKATRKETDATNVLPIVDPVWLPRQICKPEPGSMVLFFELW